VSAISSGLLLVEMGDNEPENFGISGVYYWILADLTVILHFGFVCFVVIGALLAFRWRWIVFAHLPAVVWGALIEYQGWVCPLTPLEQHFRRMAGQEGYAGGFIEYYLLPVLYPAGLTRDVQMVLGSLVIVVNILIYVWLIKRIRKDRRI
jgi:hypothetical protein